MMTHAEFLKIRTPIRWGGIGAMVDARLVDAALEIAGRLPRDSEDADSIRSVLLSLRMGVHPSQRECRMAEQKLEIVYQRMLDEDSKEMPRG